MRSEARRAECLLCCSPSGALQLHQAVVGPVVSLKVAVTVSPTCALQVLTPTARLQFIMPYDMAVQGVEAQVRGPEMAYSLPISFSASRAVATQVPKEY